MTHDEAVIVAQALLVGLPVSAAAVEAQVAAFNAAQKDFSLNIDPRAPGGTRISVRDLSADFHAENSVVHVAQAAPEYSPQTYGGQPDTSAAQQFAAADAAAAKAAASTAPAAPAAAPATTPAAT